MSAPPAFPEPPANVRPSARVAAVAELLDCHPTDIRRLVDNGELEAHRKGVRGIRVFLDSVRHYQERRTCLPKTARRAASPAPPKKRPPHAGYRAALNDLRAKGLI
jgi:excisionase family DNA binding protein